MDNRDKYYDLIDSDHLEVSLVYTKDHVALGATMGPNSFKGKKWCNFMVWLDFLFWSLEVEFKFKRK